MNENSHLGLDDFEGEKANHTSSLQATKEGSFIDYLEEIGISKELQRLMIISELKMEDAKPETVHDVSIAHVMEKFIEEHRRIIELRGVKQKW
jgi:hypothetical protein